MKLTREIVLKGKGLHSGADCELIISPCEEQEIILNGIPLRELELSGTNRGSDYIFPSGERVRTCEHVFSALNGLGFWAGINIQVNGGEMPALDGCAKTLCDMLLDNAEAKISHMPKKISQPVIISSEDKKRFIAAFPAEKLHVTYTVEYKFVGTQIFDYEQSPENYYEEISRARTFAMKSDIDYLRAHGMALGGSLENAVVIDREITASGGLRWPDEFVRHKVLDLIGDLAAVGRPVGAHIIAVRAGHELHLKLAQKLRGE